MTSEAKRDLEMVADLLETIAAGVPVVDPEALSPWAARLRAIAATPLPPVPAGAPGVSREQVGETILSKLHELVGRCGHCGSKTCAGRKSWSKLPDKLKTDDVLAAIEAAARTGDQESGDAGAGEVAVEFNGMCPGCEGGPPGGEWSNIGTFTCGNCGTELEAELSHDKDGGKHWHFTKVEYIDDEDEPEESGEAGK